MRKPLPVLASLLPAWRKAGAPAVWLNWGVRPDHLNLPPTVQFTGKRSADGVGLPRPRPVPMGWNAA